MARTQPQTRASESVAVIGLGRFGISVATSLTELGHEVLAIDSRADVVARMAGQLNHVVEADATSIDALRQLGVQDVDKAVVAIGTSIESSVLTVAALVDLELREIWAKALSRAHGRILERIGAHHVVYPELAMGQRVAHLVTGTMQDFIEFEDGFAIVKVHTPKELLNKTLAETDVRRRYGITVVGTKRLGEDFVYARPETAVREGDTLIVCGNTRAVERFAARP